MVPAILKETTISAVPNTDEESFRVRTEGYSRDLPKEINLLLCLIPFRDIVHMDKVSWLSRCHVSPIRRVADGTDCPKVTPQDSNRFREVAYVPDPAGLVLVTYGESEPIRVPRRCKGEV